MFSGKMSFKVYALYDVRCPDEILYIGKTSNYLCNRLSGHRSSARNGSQQLICMWIREIGDENIAIRLIDSTDNSTHVLTLERFYIKKYSPNFNVLSNEKK